MPCLVGVAGVCGNEGGAGLWVGEGGTDSGGLGIRRKAPPPNPNLFPRSRHPTPWDRGRVSAQGESGSGSGLGHGVGGKSNSRFIGTHWKMIEVGVQAGSSGEHVSLHGLAPCTVVHCERVGSLDKMMMKKMYPYERVGLNNGSFAPGFFCNGRSILNFMGEIYSILEIDF